MNTTKTAFQTVASELSNSMIHDKRNDGTEFYKFRDDAPKWIDADKVSFKCHEALDDRFPDDWVYEQMYFIADRFCEYEDADNAREAINEIADALVDTYNLDRAKWLGLHLNNGLLVDEAVNEFGATHEQGIFEIIGLGQYLAIERIGNALINCIAEETESRD